MRTFARRELAALLLTVVFAGLIAAPGSAHAACTRRLTTVASPNAYTGAGTWNQAADGGIRSLIQRACGL